MFLLLKEYKKQKQKHETKTKQIKNKTNKPL